MIPAFATEMVCCSIASWIDVRSSFDMHPNSSMQHTPRSARARAPASSENSFLAAPGSRTAAQVSPAVEDPVPVVRTDRCDISAAKRKNWDLPVPGSPMSRMCDWFLLLDFNALGLLFLGFVCLLTSSSISSLCSVSRFVGSSLPTSPSLSSSPPILNASGASSSESTSITCSLVSCVCCVCCSSSSSSSSSTGTSSATDAPPISTNNNPNFTACIPYSLGQTALAM
mmetsp:Transcript_8474/g.18302  ORF Transcript_8474/g.18302 Transcript_8474/m.18302 type:complete len:227 (+) Transcript_8474:1510-2190(+)